MKLLLLVVVFCFGFASAATIPSLDELGQMYNSKHATLNDENKRIIVKRDTADDDGASYQPKEPENLVRTEKCDEQHFEKFAQKAGNCLDKADAIVDAYLSEGGNILDLDSVICRSANERARCYDTHGSECWDEEQTLNKKLFMLERQMEKAYNVSFLGQDFIDSCPILNRNEANVVELFSGSRRCTYTEFQKSFVDAKKCRDKSRAAKDRGYQLLAFVNDPKSAILRIECNFRTAALKTCMAVMEKCRSQENLQNNKRALELVLSSREHSINKEIKFFDFSYNLCPKE